MGLVLVYINCRYSYISYLCPCYLDDFYKGETEPCFHTSFLKLYMQFYQIIRAIIKKKYREQEFFLLFTESQNHRIVGVGRDLCGSSSPTPLPKQGHLQ